VKIVDITTTLLSIPHLGGYQDATTRHPVEGHSALMVHIVTDAGIEGLGPGRGGQAARQIIEGSLRPLLLDRDPLRIEQIWNDLYWRVRGIGRKGLALCALSAIDIALWDLKAKSLGLPLYQLLGAYADSVPVYGSGGWTNLNVEELLDEMAGYAARGMKAVKMKVGKDFGRSEAEDMLRLAAVRDAVGDDIELYVDANGGYYAKQAIQMARKFEAYEVGWLEEPVIADDLDGLASVVRASNIPVATGEHEYTKYGFRDLMTRGAADIVQPNVTRVGGVTEWLKVVHMAEAFNLPVAPHDAQLIHLHLACATPNLLRLEYLQGHEEADKILFTEFPLPIDGMWSPAPDKPGLGLELDPLAVKLYD